MTVVVANGGDHGIGYGLNGHGVLWRSGGNIFSEITARYRWRSRLSGCLASLQTPPPAEGPSVNPHALPPHEPGRRESRSQSDPSGGAISYLSADTEDAERKTFPSGKKIRTCSI